MSLSPSASDSGLSSLSLLGAALPASIQSRIPRIPSIRRSVNIQATLFRSRSTTALVSVSSASASTSSSSSASSTTTCLATASSASSPSVSSITTPANGDGVVCDDPPSLLPQALEAAVATAFAPFGAMSRRGSRRGSSSGSGGIEAGPAAASHRPSTSRRGHAGHASSSLSSIHGDPADMGLGLVLASSDATGRPAGTSPHLVNWKYGQNGLRSLESAFREAGDPDRLPELERQIYVESVAYLLRGLPGELDDAEVHQLRHAAPEALVMGSGPGPSPSHHPPHSATSALCRAEHDGLPPALLLPPTHRHALEHPLSQRSLAHVLTHWLITRLYALAMLVLPVATHVVRLAIAFDRKHHVPEVVFAWVLGVALALYKMGMDVFVSVCGMGDGRVGRALDDGTAYLASGVASGLREAVLDVAQGKI